MKNLRGMTSALVVSAVAMTFAGCSAPTSTGQDSDNAGTSAALIDDSGAKNIFMHNGKQSTYEVDCDRWFSCDIDIHLEIVDNSDGRFMSDAFPTLPPPTDSYRNAVSIYHLDVVRVGSGSESDVPLKYFQDLTSTGYQGDQVVMESFSLKAQPPQARLRVTVRPEYQALQIATDAPWPNGTAVEVRLPDADLARTVVGALSLNTH